ncbi:DASH complex subunit Ask1-domain-containing protein [Lentinula aff. lateritia]|uniref:DASH complex subunit Ask1-domain-containing protein n=1 Tax=Lentinula aff. lateritia TaxID=2804960 RepID=A0ACC1TND2_9AGAR|nr:DASH complex subunit Ask1-domain-containing protein [Lentinula aff. lateritia]
MPDNRKPVPPNPPRWQPNPDPSTIEIPGLDTAASPQDQIEQIEQLITLKLQNIDQNFAKIHHILSTRILPAVKRYSIGTEPVREAAKFWISFYEQAAQIRIPTYEDYETVHEEGSSQQKESEPSEPSPSEAATSSISYDEQDDNGRILASAESSFAPDQAAFSSTPAANRLAHAESSHTSDDSSWSASLESPLVRLDRELRNFSQDANETESSIVSSTPTPTKPPSTLREQERSQRSINKGKSREQSEPLLRNLLRQNIHSSVNASAISTDPGPSVSPLRPKGKTPIFKDLNPFLPPGSIPSKWNGLVDLRDTSVMTPQRSRRFKDPHSSRKSPTPLKALDYDSDDDSFDGLPPGMSPPVMISPARPMRSNASIKLGQTPRKDAAARITKDIVADVQGHLGKSGKSSRGLLPDSSMSTISSLPSMSRYDHSTSSGMVTHESLESLMRQIGLKDPIAGKLPRQDSRQYEYSSANESDSPLQLPTTNDDEFLMPTPQQYQHDPYYDDDDDDDDDIINNTAHPSAAFLMASQNRHPMGDDSFDDDDDSMVDGDPNMMIPVHPFARGVSIEDDSFDDSFDNDLMQGNPMSEETLFGVLPVHREQRLGREDPGVGALMMHGGDLLDTAQLTEELARAADSPTPAAWNRR